MDKQHVYVINNNFIKEITFYSVKIDNTKQQKHYHKYKNKYISKQINKIEVFFQTELVSIAGMHINWV